VWQSLSSINQKDSSDKLPEAVEIYSILAALLLFGLLGYARDFINNFDSPLDGRI